MNSITVKSQFLGVILLVFTIIVNAQDSQNKILDLPETHLVRDYNLRFQGKNTPINIIQKSYDQRENMWSKEVTTELKRVVNYRFSKKHQNIDHKQIVYLNKKTDYSYRYDNQGRLIEYKDAYFIKNLEYNEGSFVVKSKMIGHEEITLKTFTNHEKGYLVNNNGYKNDLYVMEDGLVVKKIYQEEEEKNNEEAYRYSYNNKKQLINEVMLRFFDTKYTYNEKGDVQTSIENDINSNKTTIYDHVYHYDKYGNWVIKVDLINLSYAQGIPNFPQPTIRQIAYSNGDVTGYSELTKEVNEILEKLTKEVRDLETKNTFTSNLTWKKTEDNNTFWLFIGDESIAQECVNFYFNNHLICYYPKTKSLYRLRNYKQAEGNVIHNAEVIFKNCKYGFWYKKENNVFYAYNVQGKQISNLEINKWATNNKDLIIKGANQKNTTLLRNYKNTQLNTLMELELYEESKLSSNEKNKSKKSQNASVDKALKGQLIRGNNDNGYGEVKLQNNQVYEGFFKNGKPQGAGLLYNKSEQIFTLRDFNGLYNDKNCEFYYRRDKNGEIILDTYNKRGYYFDNKENKLYRLEMNEKGDVSEKIELLRTGNSTGCVLGDCSNGFGVYVYDNGSSYTGFFKNYKIDSCGKLVFSNGDIYIGQFSNGKKSGIGEYAWKDGKYYRGNWKNDTYHGEGVMFYSETNYEAGQWKNGKYIQ